MKANWRAYLMRRRTRVIAAGVTFIGLTGVALSATKPIISKTEEIEISAKQITSFEKLAAGKTTFGQLEWRGGLVLTSASPNFGGWSGLVFEPGSNRLVAISDAGAYLTADLLHDGQAPSRLDHAKIGPLLAANGKPLTRTRDRDAEAVTLVEGTFDKGTLLISFESNDRIGMFPIVTEVVERPSRYFSKPRELHRGPGNEGIEAMTVIKGGPYKGAILGIAEDPVPGKPGHTGWLWIDGQPKALTLDGLGDYSVTDAVSLSDGTVLLLERRFRWTEGVKMRLRRIKSEALVPGKHIASEVLLAADMAYEIDNMEGLAAREMPSGEVVLTMISDDNFNPLFQRTVLLEFALPPKLDATAADKKAAETR